MFGPSNRSTVFTDLITTVPTPKHTQHTALNFQLRDTGHTQSVPQARARISRVAARVYAGLPRGRIDVAYRDCLRSLIFTVLFQRRHTNTAGTKASTTQFPSLCTTARRKCYALCRKILVALNAPVRTMVSLCAGRALVNIPFVSIYILSLRSVC